MSKIVLLILVYSFSLLGTISLSAYQSAHIIVTGHALDKHGELKKYVIFGLTRNGKLSTFGGFREKDEKNPKTTAAREAEEESLGVLGNKKMFRCMLKNVKPITSKSFEHVCYILPEKEYGEDISEKFKKIRFDKTSKLSRCKKEMRDLVAVDLEEIRNKVLDGDDLRFKDNQGKLRSLRFNAIIIDAVKAGHFNF